MDELRCDSTFEANGLVDKFLIDRDLDARDCSKPSGLSGDLASNRVFDLAHQVRFHVCDTGTHKLLDERI